MTGVVLKLVLALVSGLLVLVLGCMLDPVGFSMPGLSLDVVFVLVLVLGLALVLLMLVEVDSFNSSVTSAVLGVAVDQE